MNIESIHLKNFKLFQNVDIVDIPAMGVFVGPNGSGKSTLFDVFGFLKDALTHNVRTALQRRGGFKEVVSRGAQGPIEIELTLRFQHRPVTYHLEIAHDHGGPEVRREILRYERGSHGSPWHVLDFQRGRGTAVRNEEDIDKPEFDMDREEQRLESPDILAIKGLGQFERFQAASAFRRLIENWHVSDFHIGDARPSREVGYAEHLSARGDNLPLVAQFMYENHPKELAKILKKMHDRIPGISTVEAAETEDGRIILKFQDGAFKDPFVARHVSDGTIKMFAYLLLLHDPKPHPLLCIEEPENRLYPTLLHELAEEFRTYAETGGQVFISTHSPDFLNAVALDEIFWLVKQDGFSRVVRARDNELLRNLYAEGDLPGARTFVTGVQRLIERA